MWYELSFHFYYLMDCETHFFKKLKQIQSKPRGIQRSHKVDSEVNWSKTVKYNGRKKIVTRRTETFCTIFNVSESTVRSLNNNLLHDPRLQIL